MFIICIFEGVKAPVSLSDVFAFTKLQVFYDMKVAQVPRIFGMTASPICGKGN